MSDLRKLQRDALSAISAEDWVSAVDLYMALERADPRESTWPLRLGECLHKLDEAEAAAAAFDRAVQACLQGNVHSKTAALCKHVLDLTPGHAEAARVQRWVHEQHGAELDAAVVRRPSTAEEPEPLSTEFQVPSSMRKAERGHKRSSTIERALAASSPRPAATPPPAAPPATPPPAAPPVEPPRETAPAAPVLHKVTPGPVATAPRVLLVHADAATLRAYARAFAGAGFVVDMATDIEPAHNIIANEHFDVIVCNIDLLGDRGVELLGDIRRLDLDVPIVLTSRDPNLDTTGAAASHGVIGSYVEPVEAAALVAAAVRAAQFHRLTRVRREAMSRLNVTGEWMGDQAGLEFHFGSALDRLWMAFQPIVSASAQDVVAFEALLRSGEEVLHSPVSVLRAAERLHRVHDVGRIIRDSVAATAASTSKAPLLCVNVHSQDLLDQHLLDPQSPLSTIAPRIILEITERTPLDELTDLRARLATLRSLGYRFAIDNLGAGHAGVAALAQLEPDVAKLDLSLIRGVDHDEVKQALVRALLDACRDMSIQVICEGVETSHERDTLVQLGADFMQGYLFAKPGPPFPSVDLSTLSRRR